MPLDSATQMSPAVFLMNNASSNLSELCAFLEQQAINLHQAHGISCEQIIDELETVNPSIILMGIDPNDNQQTFTLCDQLKKQKRYKDLPIILFSDNASQDQILQGYQHGAAEVIHAPFFPLAIYQKLSIHQNQKDSIEKLKLKIQDNKSTALAAMKDSSELGKVIQFFEHSALCKDFRALSDRIFLLFKDMSLNSSVLIHPRSSITNYFSDDGQPHQIELQLLQQFREIMFRNPHGSRFFTFQRRIIANSPNVTLLIRNCPEDNLQQGRIRDILGAIINGLDQRCASIQQALDKVEKNVLIKRVIQETESNIRMLNTLSETHGKKTISIMDNATQKLESGLAILGLSEQQEDFFIQMMRTAMEELAALQSEEIQIEKNFQDILTILHVLSEEL